MATRLSLSAVLLFAITFGLPSQLRAEPFSLSVIVPNFLIPLDGQSGTLDVFSDGTSAVDPLGFNVLGSQTFTLAGSSTSTGKLTLNLHFTGIPLGDPTFEITTANLGLRVYDFDFLTDQVTQKITLKEMAIINSVNGITSAINLQDYLPAGTTSTDDRWITLQPISLMPPLSASDFTDPFTLSLTLTAVAENTGLQSVNLVNTSEALVSNLQLTGVAERVPEPNSMLLLGLGFATVVGCGARRRRETKQSQLRASRLT